MTFSDDFVSITPVNFFQLTADCYQSQGQSIGDFPSLNKKNYKKFLLPDTSALCGEIAFAEVAICWNMEGLEFFINIDSPLRLSSYPEVSEGDSVELFIDTRDVKTSGFNTRFCHHFFFLAEGVDGRFAGEITKFRTEDLHALCDVNELKLKVSKQSTGYALNIFIPKSCLFGYEPGQFNRLGFSYRINRAEGFPQHFSVVSEDYHIEEQPSLWASLNFKN